ncbi:putative blue (type1) copper domain-containing protein [Candidatus Nitrososphaera gargensis Ga9.2]|uniref:Putative blue (Type1) copper domain-containing protein n=1 Tax=Nitrososphaera gargensis (strain Ga9.2) TaxID=1237085 RepID=K0I9V9_NITGG|nr:putative blue (type1) copper domain-containing protein [Candidatus Nitrososphaera gargensis Ga9.2]
MLGSLTFGVTGFAGAQVNVTSNATTVDNTTSTASTGNATGTNQTGGGEGTTTAAADDTFRARGTINDFISSAMSDNATAANATSDGYILGGRWRVDVIGGEVRQVQANISMAKPDGSDFHMHLIDNFTAGGGANETTTANATGANMTGGGGDSGMDNATAGNMTEGNETTTTLPQVMTGGNNTTGDNATTRVGNATTPGNETTTAQVTLSEDGTFEISGTATIYTNNDPQWENVPITIKNTGRVLTINVDHEMTDNHFMGLPIYGFVTGLIGGDNRSVLPPLEGVEPSPTTPAPTIPNATTPTGNATAPTGNETSGNQTTEGPAPSPTTNETTGGGGGQTIAVSITPGSSSKTTDSFDPNPVEASVGDTVTWTNDDSTPHTVTSGSNGQPDGRFDSSPNLNPLMNPGQTFSHTFEEAGEYPYYCALHPNMVGTVNVS